VWVDVDGDLKNTEVVDEILGLDAVLQGLGHPDVLHDPADMTQMLLARDDMGRRFYRTATELASELGVDKVVAVEPMEEIQDLVGIIVNLQDYTVGADRGGETSMFDDFDIDYNQYKYLLETRSRRADQDPVGDHRSQAAQGADAGDPGCADVRPGHLGDHDRDTAGRDVPSQRHQRGRDHGGLAVHDAGGRRPDDLRRPNAGSYFRNNVDDEWTFRGTAGA
jgi:hypothetical protein